MLESDEISGHLWKWKKWEPSEINNLNNLFVAVDPCKPNPCKNNGQCSPVYSERPHSLTNVTVQLAGEETPVNLVNELTAHLFTLRKYHKQDYIPVGCVPTTGWP